MSKEKKQSNILLLAVVSVGVCVVFLARFAQIGVFKTVNDQNLVSYSEETNARSSVTEARRGTIFDSHGAPIAMDTTSYSIYAVLKHPENTNVVKDPDVTAKVLANHLKVDRDVLLKQLTQMDVQQVEFGTVGRNISAETKQAIEAEKLPGIVFISHTTRQYINDIFSSHLIGYAVPKEVKEGTDGLGADVLEGKLGIEAAQDELLSGSANNRSSQQHILAGTDIYLTIDARLQNKLEEIMTQYNQQFEPETLNAYLVEVKTGKLLAASQRATFNLNTREGIEYQWNNLMLEEAYEPGSTIKILTMAVAHEQQLFKPNETFQSGSIQVYDQIVKDYNKVGWGNITYEEGLARSSNVAMVNLVNRIGDQNWVKKLESFGFGQSTQFGVGNETGGSFNFDNPVSRIMSGFGQGFSATPIQLLQAFSTIANHGQMMKIQYLNGVGENNQFDPKVLGTPIKAESADYVLNLMVDTVEKPYGTATSFKNPYVKVAAKTGTAQIASPDGQGYLTGPDDYYHSVVTIFPAEDPKYMMYISMKHPHKSQGLIGSQILGRLFNQFVEYVMITP